jgi:hypothetical protein
MVLEKVTKSDQIKHVEGEVPVQYAYTLGIAGDKFFKTLRDTGKFLGTKCDSCNYTYVPPRMFCETCFASLNEYIEISDKGTVQSYTINYVDVNSEKLKEPIIMALIKLDGADSVFVHKLGEIRNVSIGMRVKAVLKPRNERKGSILDIKYFKPISE